MSDVKYPCNLEKGSNGDYLPYANLRAPSSSAASERKSIKQAYRDQSTGKVPSDNFVRAFQKLEQSRKDADNNALYRFITKVAGFANEEYSRLWDDKAKDTSSSSQYSTSTLLSGGTKTSLSSVSGDTLESDEYDVLSDPRRLSSDTVNSRMLNRLSRPTVKGYMFLTPTAYAHLLESYELLQQVCGTSLPLETFVCEAKYSTYFARLMATRIQLSRFLGGRYYSAASNYQRLMLVNSRLLQWFKSKLSGKLSGNFSGGALESDYLWR